MRSSLTAIAGWTRPILTLYCQIGLAAAGTVDLCLGDALVNEKMFKVKWVGAFIKSNE